MNYSSSPAWSIRVKYSHKPLPRSPGPGEYSPLARYFSPSPKIGSERRYDFTLENRAVPGPGAYSVHDSQTSIRPQTTTIGKSLRSHVKIPDNPGPGAYEIKQIRSPRAVTLKRKYKEPAKHLSPGPGAYNIEGKKEAKMGVIGRSNREEHFFGSSQVPGPGSYDLLVKSSSGVLIGKGKRVPLHSPALSPGPAAYHAQYSSPNRGWTIKGKHKKLQRYQGPGPAKYYVQNNVENKGFTFGKEKRNWNRKEVSPGPADYHIQSSISNLPSYALSMSKSLGKIKM